MSECEYVSTTWHSLCTPWSERLHFLISKPDTLDSWPLTPHFTWVAKRPRSPFSGFCRVAGVTVDTAVLCYAELWEPPHISTTLSLRKSVSNQMDYSAVCVNVCVSVWRLLYPFLLEILAIIVSKYNNDYVIVIVHLCMSHCVLTFIDFPEEFPSFWILIFFSSTHIIFVNTNINFFLWRYC